MAQTQIVIVYSPNQNKRRRVIIPDDDSQISVHTANIAKGEAVLVGSIKDYQTIGPDAMLVAYTGKQAASDRCIVVSNAAVVDVICADPLIDTHPAGQIIADASGVAEVGYSVAGGIAVAPVSVDALS